MRPGKGKMGGKEGKKREGRVGVEPAGESMIFSPWPPSPDPLVSPVGFGCAAERVALCFYYLEVSGSLLAGLFS